MAEYEVHELVVGMPKNMNGTKVNELKRLKNSLKDERSHRFTCFILG
ncbi:MAG: hypothetical protein ACLRON_05500 [Veillonella parvula]